MGDNNPVVMYSDNVWRHKEMKITEWAGAFILYDTDVGAHITMEEVPEDEEERVAVLLSLQDYADGYRKGKRMFSSR